MVESRTERMATEQRAGSADGDAARERALKLLVVLSRASTAVLAHTRAHVARHDLTLAEFGVLEALHHKGPMLLNEIQRKILVSSGGITYLVDRLAARGFVERRACPEDRRASYAALTPGGEEFITALFPSHVAAIERALGGLDATEQAQAIRLLRALGRHAQALTPPDE